MGSHVQAARHDAGLANRPMLQVSTGLRLGLACGVTGLALLAPAGCQNPVRQTANLELQTALSAALQEEIAGTAAQEIALTRPGTQLDFTEERLQELAQMAGLDSYGHLSAADFVGVDLAGQPYTGVNVNLRDAIMCGVRNNLALQLASLDPAISETRVTVAESAFDSIFFTNIDWTKTDQATTESSFSGIPFGTGVAANETTTISSGLQKSLITGGRFEIGTSLTRADNQVPGLSTNPDPAYSAALELGVSQPLLRGFGSSANLAQVRLNRNAHRTSVEDYRSELLSSVFNIESAYWNLVLARHVLNIQERLLERGEETKNKVVGRRDHDATPSEISDAISRVQTRQIQVTRARNDVLNASDQLKMQMNSPEIPLGSETMIIPVDDVLDAAMTFNYVDCVHTSLQHRPEIRQALVAIDDASIRQMLADNLRLPRFDINARIRWTGLDDEVDQAYGGMTDDDFVDYILGAALEIPIGNREAEANYRMARLQRNQSVINYRRTVQAIVGQIKEALRNVKLNYELVSRTRDARIAAAEALRTIEVQEKFGSPLTPEFLNLKFNRQESLAASEAQEAQALVEYQVALSGLYFAMGLGLERNQIEFRVPDHQGPDNSSY
ncbi:MAG: TolC family protein [Planctomycetes bacterium]|nr:TolC family protein [Planctomycetota bacterium]